MTVDDARLVTGVLLGAFYGSLAMAALALGVNAAVMAAIPRVKRLRRRVNAWRNGRRACLTCAAMGVDRRVADCRTATVRLS